MVERTLLLIKPDGVARGLVGEILARFERRNLKIAGLKMLTFDKELAARHYAEHVGKEFYARLERFITSGPCIAVAIAGDDAVTMVRAMTGATDPVQAAPGTIRGDLGHTTPANLVHASDSPESAARETPIFFTEEELACPES